MCATDYDKGAQDGKRSQKPEGQESDETQVARDTVRVWAIPLRRDIV